MHHFRVEPTLAADDARRCRFQPENRELWKNAFRRHGRIYFYGMSALGRQLRQKNILLKGSHHRVKNNLQLISSIMNMQIRQACHAPIQSACCSAFKTGSLAFADRATKGLYSKR